MKDLGFKYSTIAGITVSAFDVVVAQEKDEIIAKAEETVKNIIKCIVGEQCLEQKKRVW